MASRSLLIAVIAAVLSVVAMAAPANVASTAQPSAIMTAEAALQTAQVSALNRKQSSASAPRPTKTAAYSTQGLPASIFPSNSYTLADTQPLNDGRELLSLQASATGTNY